MTRSDAGRSTGVTPGRRVLVADRLRPTSMHLEVTMTDRAAAESRPNILWYCADQLRGDAIGPSGNPYVRTPNLDRLAAMGTTFTSAYCQAPICTPSRASFLTGKYPSSIP